MTEKPSLMADGRVGTGVVASILGVGTETVRRWSLEGKLAAVTTPGGHRRYDPAEVRELHRVRAATAVKKCDTCNWPVDDCKCPPRR
ncbi:MerR family transcriptional regulator [Nocardiopsis sp. CA-288880]|uniref:MerR family transcriptional regulator n=1 Tax=Nocardiopsis sp. CA-288880 TaxID=3239995 RepID=UPI003D9661CC